MLPGRQKGTYSMRLAVARREADSLVGCKRQDRLELCRQFLLKTEVARKGGSTTSTAASVGKGRRRGRPPGKKQKPAASEGLTKPFPQSQCVQLQARIVTSSALLQTSSSLAASRVLQLPPSTQDGTGHAICLSQFETAQPFQPRQVPLPASSQPGVGSGNKSPGLLQLVPSAGT